MGYWCNGLVRGFLPYGSGRLNLSGKFISICLHCWSDNFQDLVQWLYQIVKCIPSSWWLIANVFGQSLWQRMLRHPVRFNGILNDYQ